MKELIVISAAYEVNSIDCEGCGVCVYFCPEKAIDFPINTCGEWFISDTRFGPMVHAQTIFEYNNGSKAGHAIKGIWNYLSDELGL